MADRQVMYSWEEVEKIKGDAFIKGIDYGIQIQANKDTVTIPKVAFDKIMEQGTY